MTTAFELTDVGMHFRVDKSHEDGQHRVLQGLSLSVAAGERVGLVGRNGAGKSTLLRILAGILPPAAGNMWRNPQLSVALLSLGLGFKNDLTGRENAYLSAVLQGLSGRQAKAKLKEIGEFTELGVYFDEPVKTYSNGMRARLGFATALLLDTDIILIDEILSVGDQAFKVKAREALQEKLEGHRTVILVHHAEAVIRELCTRAIWLGDGRVQQDGSVDDVLPAYLAAG